MAYTNREIPEASYAQQIEKTGENTQVSAYYLSQRIVFLAVLSKRCSQTGVQADNAKCNLSRLLSIVLLGYGPGCL